MRAFKLAFDCVMLIAWVLALWWAVRVGRRSRSG